MSMEKKQSTWQERFRAKFKAPEWAPQKMQEIFNELMFEKDGVEDFISSEREALLREILEEVEKMIHHRRTIGCSVGHINTLTELQEIIKKKI